MVPLFSASGCGRSSISTQLLCCSWRFPPRSARNSIANSSVQERLFYLSGNKVVRKDPYIPFLSKGHIWLGIEPPPPDEIRLGNHRGPFGPRLAVSRTELTLWMLGSGYFWVAALAASFALSLFMSRAMSRSSWFQFRY